MTAARLRLEGWAATGAVAIAGIELGVTLPLLLWSVALVACAYRVMREATR